MLSFKKIFELDFSGLKNITLDDNFSITLYCLIIGVVLSIVWIAVTKMFFGRFIRELIKRECLGKENAKSLSELGFSKNVFIKLSLYEGNLLYNTTSSLLKDEYIEKVKDLTDKKDKKALKKARFEHNFKLDKFYITPDKKDVLEDRFSSGKNGILSAVIAIILSVVGGIIIVKFTPSILKLVDNLIELFKS